MKYTYKTMYASPSLFRVRAWLLVTFSWIWMFIGAFISTILITYIVKGILTTDIDIISATLYDKPYLASYVEIVAVGGPQLAISLISRDDFRLYGLKREGLLKSILLAILPAIAILIARIVTGGGVSFKGFGLDFPLNIFYASLSIVAYGPLEIFFIIWLIVNTDTALRWNGEGIISPGLILTVLIFGLSHIILSARGGLTNALWVTTIFLYLSLTYKYTKNSIGPVISWTLINHQVLYLALGCLMP